MKQRLLRSVSIVVIGLAMSSGASGKQVMLPQTSGAFLIDGVADEAAWSDAVRIELDIETNPGENIPARVETTAYLVEDGANLFVAIHAKDPDPGAIRAFLRDRDSAYDDDFAGIIIDTYNDGRRAFEFFSNPLGVQMDLTNDDVSQEEDDSWDAIWDSAGQITDDGYIIEMKIPLNQLRFPHVDGTKTWAFDLQRTYPRDKRYRFSNTPNDLAIGCYLCQLGTLSGFDNAEPGRDLEIIPTLTASQVMTTDEVGVDPLVRGDMDGDAGVTVRWGITPDMTANLAINPDFSQVEADAAQLDVDSQFSLFFPEKRPFFLEGADYFRTPIEAVFTRTVADPDIGAKLTGKRDRHTYALFVAEDATTNLLVPGTFGDDTETLEHSNTAIVGRYNLSIGGTSSVGALLTSREGGDYSNQVGGVDAHWQINDQNKIRFQHLESRTEYPDDIAAEFEQPPSAFNGNATAFEYEWDPRDWVGRLRYTRFSDGFRADSGFVGQVGVDELSAELNRFWRGEEDDWWTRVRLRGEYEISHLEDGRVLEREASVRLGVGGPMQSWTQVRYEKGTEFWDGREFDTQRIQFYMDARPIAGVSYSLWAQLSDRVDYANSREAEQLSVQPTLDWNIGRNLLLRLNTIFSSLETTEGERVFDASIVDARLTWQFSRRSFLRVTVQSSDVDRNPDAYIDEVDSRSKDVGRQLLYSYKLNPQSVFFLGYSDQYVDDDQLMGLTASDRSIFMKVGYAFSL